MRKKAIRVNWVRGFFPFGFSCTDTLWYISTAYSDPSVLAAPLACHSSHVDALSCIVRMARNDERSQMNTSQNEGNKSQGKRENDNNNVTSSGGNCNVTAFLRPVNSLPTLK